MSTEYRRSGMREFYRIEHDSKTVTRVMNKESFARIDVSVNHLIYEDSKDEATTRQCTEVEFMDQYDSAMQRIQSKKV